MLSTISKTVPEGRLLLRTIIFTNMKRIFQFAAVAAVIVAAAACSTKYESVPGDPMGTRIYTLDNGLKVYMSVNKETPRIQTYIAVRSGGKNDPADNTGLAHYLEHIMFKGTEKVGTQDYEAEKPMLDQIQSLYDVYRTKTDPAEREAIYHQIDSISYEASKIAIPNEYDKMMAIIGSEGSNAFTSDDVTCYQEDIPANQIENWAKVQSDRFKNMVIRGFHTELEAVYEEYNRGLTSDTEKALDAVDAVLFKNHPYGTQTVIGTQEHLKNPDITAIKKQKATYYVPNNCAICVSGDFDPKEMLSIIKKYFGDWQPNPNLPEFTFAPEQPITSPVEINVNGYDASFAMIAWRTPGLSSKESEIAQIASSILYNGMAGLIDLDIVQQQKMLAAQAMNYDLVDYSEMILLGYPLEGQSLQEVRDLLLAEADKLRKGDFDADLVQATVNNIKLRQMRSLQSNSSRAMMFVNSFINKTTWKDEVEMISRLEAITKDDVVAWANKYMGPQNYAIVYKNIGDDPNIKKVEAPKITPIVTNRDKQSAFLLDIQNSVPKPIEPVFVDYSKEMSIFTSKGLEVLYKQNTLNDIASLGYRFDMGTINDPALGFAIDYLSYLGTPTRSAEQISSEMYKLACSFGASAGTNSSQVSISGLSENLPKAMEIVEDLIANAVPDENILASLKMNMLKNRQDSKLSQRAVVSALRNYITYGPEYIKSTTLTNEQLMSLTSEELLSKVKSIFSKEHKVTYYGPLSQDEFKSVLEAGHNVPATLEPLKKVYPQMLQTPQSAVYVAQYNSQQFNYVQYSNRGEKLDLGEDANVALFNEYFGGGMNTIVFQEMRESRALAYSAGANLANPSYKDGNYSFTATIGSQNDKLEKAVTAFDEIINDMPESESAFEIAKTALISGIRTSRVTGAAVINRYLSDQEMGVTEPRNKKIFEKAQTMTLSDLSATQKKWIKDRTYVYGIVGDANDLDMVFLSTLGPVKVVSLEEIFGY